MSNEKRLDAKLKEYDGGPFFPPALAKVQKRFKYHPERLHHMFLDMLSHRLSQGKVSFALRTTDGYVWAAGLSFVFESIRCKILIPMRHDHLRSGGTYADRHVALYAKNIQCDEEFQERAAVYFAELFKIVYKSFYETSITHSKRRAGKK